jgi:hypothetical protein
MKELVHLDCCRMVLWSPEDTSEVDGLEKETITIDSAINNLENFNYQDFQAYLEALTTLADPDRTLFADAVAETLESRSPANLIGVDSRLVDARLAAKHFQDIKTNLDVLHRSLSTQYVGMHSALVKWVPHMSKWADLANNSIQRLEGEAQP